MKNTQKWFMLAAVAMVWSNLGAAEKQKPAMAEVAGMSMTATVEDIDYKARKVTLKNADGKQVTMDVGPEAIRFDKIKKGDIVEAEYLESVTIIVQSPDKSVATAEGSQSAIVRNAGDKPSGTAVQTDVAMATVEKINAKKRTATLKGPDGKSFDVNVGPEVEHLENVKKGDQVMVKVTRTLALDIHKPGK